MNRALEDLTLADVDTTANHSTAAGERKTIWLLCLLAAAHVLIFSAAFPFFNLVDEKQHFDNVVRYAHADFPRAVAPLSDEALNFIAVYHTPEYLWSPTNFPGGKIQTPPWKQLFETSAPYLIATKTLSKQMEKNQEASQPPLYYSCAALWWHLGKTLGLDGGGLLYWLRFMNALCVAGLVWIGHLAARTIFPERTFLRLALPAVIAVLPQSAFYAIQNDVLSPLGFGAVFILLVKFWLAEIPGWRLGLATGLAMTATLLAKISNAPLLAVATAFGALKILQLLRMGKFRASFPAILALTLSAGIPAALWLAWCKINFGDLTGSEPKILVLGWTHKPFAEWWSHPIFTPAGFWAFFSDLLATFWQGEILWQRQPLAWTAANLVYVLSTIIFLGVALAGVFAKSALEKNQRRALGFGFVCFAAAVAFLGLLSTVYDFHDCFRPSRGFPYFTSGRMMLGVLIPFLLLYLYGLERVLEKFAGLRGRLLILGVLLVVMLATETAINWKIFANEYNWFHL